ncbi:Cysteine synthase [Monocercomonoides exilis]|uniref:Cysteine synthase n=1 Tax=Monocercomonoides exilis TaxID=2049356 RepID=UPI003559EFB4|nr:Cysteine synthase [Monocercomonoides exilis]
MSSDLISQKIHSNIGELVGNTPLVRLNRVCEGCRAQIVAKLESFNPCLSVKDRVGFAMIEDAEKKGIIKPGESIICEPTSGNTGIGLALAASIKGYKAIIVMPSSMSVERRVTMAAMGCEVVITPGELGMIGAIKKAQEIQTSNPKVWIPQQFENPANAHIHELTTGPEIWNDTAGSVDYFVSGVGTGGTISGVSRYLKSKKSSVKAVAVEPFESAVLSGETAHPHKIQGIGAGFVPKIYDQSVIDEVMKVKGDDAIKMAQLLCSKEGIFCGISAGAAVCAAVELAKREDMEGKMIVVLLPDNGSRYLSSSLFESINKEMSELPISPLKE